MTYGNSKNKKADKFETEKEKPGKKGQRWMSIGTMIGIVVAGVVLFTLPKLLPPPQVNAHNTVVAEHAHVHIEGVALPAGIGINSTLWKDHSLDKYGANGYAPLHVHAADGYIHIETTERRVYTLQDFLNIWGVQYKELKLYYVTDPNPLTGISTYTPIPNPLQHVLLDGEKLKLELN